MSTGIAIFLYIVGLAGIKATVYIAGKTNRANNIKALTWPLYAMGVVVTAWLISRQSKAASQLRDVADIDLDSGMDIHD